MSSTPTQSVMPYIALKDYPDLVRTIQSKKTSDLWLTDDEKYYNRLVRRIRQPVESLFNWIQEKTQIQRASKVRSTDALMIHCWGKLAVAFFLLVFNY